MPVRKKKKRSSNKLLNSKTKWIVFTGALVCMAVVIAVSLLGSDNFQPISYKSLDGSSSGASYDGDAGPGWDVEELKLDWPENVTFTPEGDVEIFYDPQSDKADKKNIVENTYMRIFTSMENRYRRELTRLLDSATADYIAVKKGQKDISIGRLALEYINAGKQLEKDADRNFDRVLGDLRSELKEQGLPMDMADQAQEHYKDLKSQLRKDMLQKVARYAGD
ncbi:hypothetical protein ABDB91_19070 [Desulfoscipio sp. XC116]|uniref:hypothetical protein n=1 Tax=Desulfoscipio sp. XC116 TaxID=3144975 RepID=UPI00325AF567